MNTSSQISRHAETTQSLIIYDMPSQTLASIECTMISCRNIKSCLRTSINALTTTASSIWCNLRISLQINLIGFTIVHIPVRLCDQPARKFGFSGKLRNSMGSDSLTLVSKTIALSRWVMPYIKPSKICLGWNAPSQSRSKNSRAFTSLWSSRLCWDQYHQDRAINQD